MTTLTLINSMVQKCQKSKSSTLLLWNTVRHLAVTVTRQFCLQHCPTGESPVVLPMTSVLYNTLNCITLEGSY